MSLRTTVGAVRASVPVLVGSAVVAVVAIGVCIALVVLSGAADRLRLANRSELLLLLRLTVVVPVLLPLLTELVLTVGYGTLLPDRIAGLKPRGVGGILILILITRQLPVLRVEDLLSYD